MSVWPKREFSRKLHCSRFNLIIVLYHAAKLEKILWVDPEIWACIILSQIQTKIAHLVPKKGFFKKFYLIDLCLLTVPYHAARFPKIIRVDPVIFCTIILKKKKFKQMLRWKYEVFLENFTPATFIYLLSSTILQSLKRILRADPGM